MESSRKKLLEKMQKGLVAYKVFSEGWDVSDHFGDGFDLIAEKQGRISKLELKAIDLSRCGVMWTGSGHAKYIKVRIKVLVCRPFTCL